MIVWITGEGNKAEERRLGDAIAGAYEKAIVLHGQEFIEEFKLEVEDERGSLLLMYRLAVIAKILEKQGTLVVIAHTAPQLLIQNLRRRFVKSMPVVIDETIHEAINMPFVSWHKGDRVTDRDDLVETILRRIKEESHALDNTARK